MEFFSFAKFALIQSFGLFIALFFAAVFLFLILWRLHSKRMAIALFAIFFGVFLFVYVPRGLPSNGLAFPFFLNTYGPSDGPVLPLKNIYAFFQNIDAIERPDDIAKQPTDIPPAIERTEPAHVEIDLVAKEVIAEMAPGVTINYWTFGGTVPGPFLRVREGDTVTLTLTNDPSSIHHHSIDLHAVTGPGGGANATSVAPGESKSFTFKALHPGLYVYHCAHPNVANHMAHGMYGLILVEPEAGMAEVDHEFYMMQGEFYSTGHLGKNGLQIFDAEAMLDGKPQYVVFNGRTGALADNMHAEVGDTIRIFVGNGGVNLVSSFHAIGEIFDRVFLEGALSSEPRADVQTTLVPAGGATVVEFDVQVPGTYVLVDHALARLDRGAWGILSVTGEGDSSIFSAQDTDSHDSASHAH